MDKREFTEILNDTVDKIRRTLEGKGREYAEAEADSDRLIQFKLAAALRQISPADALFGMMAKHTTKLYFMLNQHEVGDAVYNIAQWDEVIIDHINYLILLRALLFEYFEIPSQEA